MAEPIIETQQRILVVEDDAAIRRLLVDELRAEGFDVHHAGNGEAALFEAARNEYDLVVLDLQLPVLSGTEVLRRLRADGGGVLVIILSARAQEGDRVRGLELGADDYVTKPFSPLELTARIRALLRRRDLDRGGSQVLEAGGVKLDLMRHETFIDGAAVHLTRAEFRILSILVRRSGGVVTRNELVKELWGAETYDPRAAYVHISNLRKKVEDDAANPRHVVTVSGLGYRLGGV